MLFIDHTGLFLNVSLGVKPMEMWGGDDQSSSWNQEEEVEIGMWSNTGGQQESRSHDHNTWKYKQKGPNKVCIGALLQSAASLKSPLIWNTAFSRCSRH